MASFSEMRQRLNSVGSGKGKTKITALPTPTLGSAVFAPSLPGVNLLPSIFAQRQANRLLARRFLLAGAGLVLLLAVLFALQFVVKFFQQTDLNNLQSTGQTYTSQIQRLTPYQNYKTSLGAERNTLGSALKSDIDMSALLTTLNGQATRYGVKYSNISLTVGGTGACIADPFSTDSAAIGCVSMTGTANSQAAVSNFFANLNNARLATSPTTPAFLNGFPASLTGGAPGTTSGTFNFTGSVSFSQAFYSNKYNGLTQDIDTLVRPAQQETANGTGATLLTQLKTTYPQTFTAATTTTQVSTLSAQVCSFVTSRRAAGSVATQVTQYAAALKINISDIKQASAVGSLIVSKTCADRSQNIIGSVQ